MDWTIAAVLCAALAHASWNALVKNSGDRFFMLASIRLVGLGVGIGLALIVPFPDPAACERRSMPLHLLRAIASVISSR
jgi:hypothetical protein